MEPFEGAKTIRLKGPHGKYLWAEEDHYSTSQREESRHQQAFWIVESNAGSRPNTLRFKSCFDSYLTACDYHNRGLSLLSFSGKRTEQMRPENVENLSSLDWEPVVDKGKLKLKSCYGSFLRGNSSKPPWQNTVTHDIPRHVDHEDWLHWEIENVRLPRSLHHEQLASKSMENADIHQVPVGGKIPKTDSTIPHSRLQVSS